MIDDQLVSSHLPEANVVISIITCSFSLINNMKINAVILIILLIAPLMVAEGSPIKASVPIYVPANLPVSGTVCIPSSLAIGLKARLYVDKTFVEEGEINESGCYKVIIKPLKPGKHDLHAEIYKGSLKVAEIEAEVIAIRGMILVKPDPLATLKRGERKVVSLYLENRSPINMSRVKVEIEAPFSIFAYHMTRVRNFAVAGYVGDLLVNESKEIKLIFAVPRELSPGRYNINVNVAYKVAGSEYSVPLKTSLIVSNETIQPKVAPKEVQTSESEGVVRENIVSPWLIALLAIIGFIVVAAIIYLVSKSS